MAKSGEDQVSCPACAKRYRWSSRVAGRKVKCKGCEGIIRMPEEPANQVELIRAGRVEPAAAKSGTAYELSIDPEENIRAARAPTGSKCPSCNQTLGEDAVICLNCGYHTQDGTHLETVVQKGKAKKQSTTETRGAAAKSSPIRRKITVIGLILVLIGSIAFIIFQMM